MRILKLVIWDLDETILTGIFEEGDEEVDPIALDVIQALGARGILQGLATQNQPEVIPHLKEKFEWGSRFVIITANLGPKINKVRHILETLEINPLDAIFVDNDPFERDSIAIQTPGITAWSVTQLADYLNQTPAPVTTEANRRPQMYLEQQARDQGLAATDDYTAFLQACNIQITNRPYLKEDLARVEELLVRTHRMNLGVLPVDEAVSRLDRPGEHHVVVAEMKDNYGDMGRCGVIHLRPAQNDEAVIESLAISCRTRARGLSLAMLVGLLRHPNAQFEKYRCRYVDNGSNRPLRMLLMGAGFKPQSSTGELVLTNEQLATLELPDWVQINNHSD